MATSPGSGSGRRLAAGLLSVLVAAVLLGGGGSLARRAAGARAAAPASPPAPLVQKLPAATDAASAADGCTPGSASAFQVVSSQNGVFQPEADMVHVSNGTGRPLPVIFGTPFPGSAYPRSSTSVIIRTTVPPRRQIWLVWGRTGERVTGYPSFVAGGCDPVLGPLHAFYRPRADAVMLQDDGSRQAPRGSPPLAAPAAGLDVRVDPSSRPAASPGEAVLAQLRFGQAGNLRLATAPDVEAAFAAGAYGVALLRLPAAPAVDVLVTGWRDGLGWQVRAQMILDLRTNFRQVAAPGGSREPVRLLLPGAGPAGRRDGRLGRLLGRPARRVAARGGAPVAPARAAGPVGRRLGGALPARGKRLPDRLVARGADVRGARRRPGAAARAGGRGAGFSAARSVAAGDGRGGCTRPAGTAPLCSTCAITALAGR